MDKNLTELKKEYDERFGNRYKFMRVRAGEDLTPLGNPQYISFSEGHYSTDHAPDFSQKDEVWRFITTNFIPKITTTGNEWRQNTEQLKKIEERPILKLELHDVGHDEFTICGDLGNDKCTILLELEKGKEEEAQLFVDEINKLITKTTPLITG